MQSHPFVDVNDVIHCLNSSNKKINYSIWGNLTDLLKKANLHNPYDPKSSFYLMWEEQTGVNFPMLYVASVYLYYYAKAKGCDTFLFATRDCCHWLKIFKKLFPDTNTHYFHCSRNMFEKAYTENNKNYKKYVQSLIKTNVEKTIYIDIHGTCKRVLKYFNNEFEQLPHCFLLSSRFKAYGELPKICKKAHKIGKLINTVFDARGTPIEMLNFDVIGTCQNYTSKGPIRDEPEYSVKWLEPYHICIDYIVEHMVSWEQVVPSTFKNEKHSFDFDDLASLIRRIYHVIQDNKPILIDYIQHPGKH